MIARRLVAGVATVSLGLIGCGGDDDAPVPDAEPPIEVQCPSVAPTVNITYPADGAPHAAAFIDIAGTSTDADAVHVSVNGGDPITAAGDAAWLTTVQLEAGETHTITATPIGRRGCTDGTPVTHTVVQGREITLVEPPPSNQVELRLDRLALGELLTPAEQEQIELTRLDLRPLVSNALAALEDPEAWGMDTSAWTASERNLASLLVMSPDTAVLDGTALAAVMDLSGQLGLPPPHLLASLLDVPPTQRFLDPEIVGQVMIDLLIRSHPLFGDDPEGRMIVTLADGLGDLAPLFEKYGPSGDHPGFLAEPPAGELFTPAFAMVVQGTGNIAVRPGLEVGVGFASHIEQPPAGTPILELDFDDPETFRIEGLHPEPRAALTLEVPESADFFPLPDLAAEAPPPPADVDPGTWDTPRKRSAAFREGPWMLERIVAEASYRAFSPLWPDGEFWSFTLGAIVDAATIDWTDGLVTVDVVADLGPPPEPAYIWDLILDVAQQRMRDGGVVEGEGGVRLALPLLPIGLDAEGLIDSMRPILQAQRAALVGLMVGDPSILESEATLYLDPEPALVVVDGAEPLYASRADLEAGTAGVGRVALGAQGQRFWTRSADGAVVVLDVGPWTNGRVTIGHTVLESP